MGIIELALIAVALSMDAFAIALCTGLTMKRFKMGKAVVVGAYFGGFQALMPLIGYFAGVWFADLIENFDHWIAFLLLALIGGKMVFEGLKGKDDDNTVGGEEASVSPKRMLPLAIATSIDALAVGVSFAVLSVEIAPAITFIGVATFAISVLGVKIGQKVGAHFKSKAEVLGGCVLILIGLKILLEHTGVL